MTRLFHSVLENTSPANKVKGRVITAPGFSLCFEPLTQSSTGVLTLFQHTRDLQNEQVQMIYLLQVCNTYIY